MSRWKCPSCGGPTNLHLCPCDKCCEVLLSKQAKQAEQVAAAERAVIDAAKAYANDTLTGRAVLSQELIKAVRALEAEEG